MKATDLLASLINDAFRNRKPEVHAALLLLREPVAALEEQVLEKNRMIAAIVMQSGGEVRVDELTIKLLPMDAEILIHYDQSNRGAVVQVRTPKISESAHAVHAGKTLRYE